MKGPRAGSDGSDGKFRMIIANHYKQMASARENFIMVFRCQLIYFLLTFILVLAQAMVIFNIKSNSEFNYLVSVREEEVIGSANHNRVIGGGLAFIFAYLVAAFLGRAAVKNTDAQKVNIYIVAMLVAGALMGASSFYHSNFTSLSKVWFVLTIADNAFGIVVSLLSSYFAHQFAKAVPAKKKK